MAIAQQYIQLLNTCLATYCQPMYQRLQPPLEKSAIEAYFNEWEIEDENLMDIFLWKNGIENEGVLPGTFSYDFTGFGVIPELKYIDNLMKMEKESSSWPSSLFPLVASFGGDFFLYETNKRSSQYGMLFLRCPTRGFVDDMLSSYYDSIQQMIVTINECFETGAFIYNSNEFELSEKFELVSVIRKKNNPHSGNWLNIL